jgi:hypothetical protein
MRWYFVFILMVAFSTSLAQGFPDYYDIPSMNLAREEAKQRHLPMAWLGVIPEDLYVSNPLWDSTPGLEQTALTALKDKAVIIVFDHRKINSVPYNVQVQFHLHDKDEMPSDIDWKVPKIVFTSPETGQILGHVSATQLEADHAGAITTALKKIADDAAVKPTPVATAPPSDDNGTSLVTVVIAALVLVGLGCWAYFGRPPAIS